VVAFHDLLDLVPFDIASVGPPVLRVLHEIAGLKPNPGVDTGENPDHPAPTSDLPHRPLRHVRRGDLFSVHFREAVELERVLEPVLKTADRIGEAASVFLGQVISRPPGAFSIRLQPDLF